MHNLHRLSVCGLVLFFIVTQFFLADRCHAQLRINEIMYAPASSEAEWIELHNNSDHDVDLEGWVLHDATSSRPVISDRSLLIPANSCIVISESSSILDRFPELAGMLHIMKALPALNNTGDDIVLLDPGGSETDRVNYRSSWGGGKGVSLERISFGNVSSSPDNWASCTAEKGATPGKKNSVSPLEHDLEITGGSVANGNIRASIRNRGLLVSSPSQLHIFHDRNTDGIGDAEEKLTTAFVPALQPGDSAGIESALVLPSGKTTVLLLLDYTPDERPENNSLSIVVTGPAGRGALLLNEIMYAPLSGDVEWVEFLNPTPEAVDIDGFVLTTGASGASAVLLPLPDNSLLIPPDWFLVIAKDSTVLITFQDLGACERCLVAVTGKSLSLNNDDDGIVLSDAAGEVVDSVHYFSDWHNPDVVDSRGRSLELLHPSLGRNRADNWSTCSRLSGGTPGTKNSLYTEIPPLESGNSTISFHPNPFSPDGDGFEDHCIIRYCLPPAVSQIRLRIYDSSGRLLRTLAGNVTSGRNGETVWDGRDDSDRRVPLGMYPALLEAMDIRSNTMHAMKGVIVVATRL